MIKIISTTTTIDGIEHLSVFGKFDSTNENISACTIMREDLDEDEKSIYDAAIALIPSVVYANIINTDEELEVTRMTSSLIDIEEQEVDFSGISKAKQNKLKALIELLISKK